MISVINQQYDVAGVLINNMDSFDEMDNWGNNVLFYAFYEKGIFERLIKKGRIYFANINCEVISLLMKAVMKQRGDVIRESLQAGTPDNQSNGEGKTTIFYAVQRGYVDIINIMVKSVPI